MKPLITMRLTSKCGGIFVYRIGLAAHVYAVGIMLIANHRGDNHVRVSRMDVPVLFIAPFFLS